MAERTQWPKNWILWATDPRMTEREAAAWCRAWGGEDGVLSLSGPDTTAADLLRELRSVPMFREVQPVRLRHAEGAEADLLAALDAYLDRPSPSSALLIEVAADLSKPAGVWKSLLGKVPSRDLRVRSVRAYAETRAQAEGFRLTPEALEGLDEWSQGDPALAARALDLLFLYKADEKVVDGPDLPALLGAGGTPRQWDAVDAFVRGDARTLAATLAAIRRDPDAVPLAFLGMVAKQVRSLLYLRSAKASGRSFRDVEPRELGFSHPAPVRRLLENLERWPEEKIRRALGVLYDLDLSLKGGVRDDWGHVERHLLRILKETVPAPP